MSVPTYLFHSLPLKLLKKGMDFSFPPLKFQNKGREEYSKIIFFIHFHFLLPNEGLISKKNNVLNIKDFRPISLVGTSCYQRCWQTHF